MDDSKQKIVRICEMGDKEFDDYDEDTLFEWYDPPLRNPLHDNKQKQRERSE